MAIPMLIAILAAAAPLAAIGFEYWPGLPPCALCLWQRWPYWVAAGLALVALPAPARLRAWLLGAAGLAVAVSGGIAALHVGVEQGWWPSPLPGCLAPSVAAGASIDDLLLSMAPLPTKPCDEAAYLVPGLPLSLAAMNLIYAALLAGWTLRQARREWRI